MNRPPSRAHLYVLLVGAALLVSGPNRCREDYVIDFGSLAATATPTDDEGDEIGTSTPTATATATPTSTDTSDETDEMTPTPTATATATVVAEMVALRELHQAAQNAPGARTGSGNWLGRAFVEQEQPFVDADGDGFSDELEGRMGSNPENPALIPPMRERLLARLIAVDRDQDGVADLEEARLGTNAQDPDSDGDGAPDGAEVISNTSPVNPDDKLSRAADADGDGLVGSYEESIGTSPTDRDTDHDGLSDDRELALGSNPLVRDTDQDGALDGAEVQYGFDPVVPAKS